MQSKTVTASTAGTSASVPVTPPAPAPKAPVPVAAEEDFEGDDYEKALLWASSDPVTGTRAGYAPADEREARKAAAKKRKA